MPALVVLSRLVVPVLLTDADDEILFVNPAFADLVGVDSSALQTVTLNEICHTAGADITAGDYGGWRGLVKLAHADGWPIYASMTSDWFSDCGSPVRLATFTDVDKQVWATTVCRQLPTFLW
ncbi:MAG: PAS domain-containing protein [Mycobacterium sp.]